jgi:putative Mn2+ efflux pump MntP
MDCFAVSLSPGITKKNNLPGTAAIIAFCFGVLQAGMTLLGPAAGTWLIVFIGGFDYWLAFLLIVFVV